MADTYLWKVTVRLESVNTGEVLSRSIKGELPHLAEDIGDSVLVKDVLEEARRAYHTGKTDPAQQPLPVD
jgi:hypothetical protein